MSSRRSLLTGAVAGALTLCLPRWSHAKPIDWPRGIEWQTFEKGARAAAKHTRPMCLVVYADWCGRCVELASLFARDDVKSLSKKFVMVRQNADEKPKWLGGRFGDTGRYVPRVLFLAPGGTLMNDVTSGVQQYPYFYEVTAPKALTASMNKALLVARSRKR